MQQPFSDRHVTGDSAWGDCRVHCRLSFGQGCNLTKLSGTCSLTIHVLWAFCKQVNAMQMGCGVLLCASGNIEAALPAVN